MKLKICRLRDDTAVNDDSNGGCSMRTCARVRSRGKRSGAGMLARYPERADVALRAARTSPSESRAVASRAVSHLRTASASHRHGSPRRSWSDTVAPNDGLRATGQSRAGHCLTLSEVALT